MREITIVRRLGKRQSKIKEQVETIANRAISGERGRGWEATYRVTCDDSGNDILYTARIKFVKKGGRSKEAEDKQWTQICVFLARACQHSRFGDKPWKLEGEDEDDDKPTVVTNHTSEQPKSWAKVNTDPGDHFKHIYDRESQIMIVRSAIEAALITDMRNRFHCVLEGEPGCGKTEILLSIGEMLGKEHEAYIKFDATNATAAGTIKLLMELPVLPPVMIVEEIEKTDEKTLRWLLGVLDQRAEIRQTNYRVGHRQRRVPMLCLATVNNHQLFETLMSGALASRFPNKVYCPRPDRTIMEMILNREVEKVKGDPRWIEPTLKYCYDDNTITDPRAVVPVCLCGRDRLLDGSYQKDLDKVKHPSRKE